jgi:hypothetical protein
MSSAPRTAASSASWSESRAQARQRVLDGSMNAGGTDAAPTIAGPGFRLTTAPMIAVGAPTISAEAMATTATARATIDTSALRHARCFFGGSGVLEKTPRPRGVRAARGGGNGFSELNAKALPAYWRHRLSLTQSRDRPGIQRGRMVRTLRVTCRSMLRSMIFSLTSCERVYRVHGTQLSAPAASAAAADSVLHMSKIHTGHRVRQPPDRPVLRAGRQGGSGGTCAITKLRSGKRAGEAHPPPTAATWRRPTNSR